METVLDSLNATSQTFKHDKEQQKFRDGIMKEIEALRKRIEVLEQLQQPKKGK